MVCKSVDDLLAVMRKSLVVEVVVVLIQLADVN